MSTHCPSCGSVVDENATTCSVCGESLTETNETNETTTPEPAEAGTVGAVPPAVAGVPQAAPPSARVICAQCGAANARGATECTTCGAPLSDVEPEQRRTAAAAPAASTGSLQTYLIAGLAMVVVALIVYIVSTPEEKTGPPQASMPGAGGTAGANPQGAMPPDHPPIDEGAQMAAMTKLVTDLETKLKADPTNDSLELALANALYDVGNHAQAKMHYAEYLKTNPQDLDATTDFATSVAAAGNIDSAVIVLNSVLAKDAKHQRAAFNMAIMYRQKENRDSIIYWLQRVADIDSTSPTGKGALDILKEFKSGHPPL